MLTEIDGRSTANVDLDDSVALLRGEPGSAASLGVLRPGAAGPTRVELRRERIAPLPAIARAETLDGRIGYVRLSQLPSGASRELTAAIGRLREGEGGIRGLVLDLRGNGGGLLEEALRIADLFLSRGVIAQI